MSGPRSVHLDLDGAWPAGSIDLATIDARAWGPKLRFFAPERLVEDFYQERGEQLGQFTLYGSGDFHHLSALWLRHLTEPATVVSFDNHPDWDIRPPKWACGGWVNRALDLPQIKRVSVWGCGNFECWWPGQIFGNRRAERNGRLEVHPWSDDRSLAEQKRRGAIRRDDWRAKFEGFASGLETPVYITIDLDCLRPEQALTNWENGRFEITDLTWALQKLREKNRIVGGDICGAYSSPLYDRWTQKFAAGFDHPRLPPHTIDETRSVNLQTVETLWPALTQ